MRDVTPQEVRVALTRVCLRSGAVQLPGRSRAALPDDGPLEAYDPEGQEAWDLELRGGRLLGLGPFLERHALAVNDEIVLRPRDDAATLLLARPRARSAARDVAAVRRAVAALLAGGPPRSADELREDHGLAPDAPLEAALRREPLLEVRAGRWALVGRSRTVAWGAQGGASEPVREGGDRTPARGSAPHERASGAPADRPDAPPPAGEAGPAGGTQVDAATPLPSRGASPASLNRAREAFAALGYRVTAGHGGTLRVASDLGRSRTRALVRVLDDGDAPDWGELLRTLRGASVDHLALVGDVRDLTRLERPARGARATLWSWDGLARATDLARQLPIGPAVLAPHWREDGLHGPGLARFEDRVATRVGAQGRFSAVAERLAGLRAPATFLVDDLRIDDDLPRDAIVAELDRMAAPPLQWTEHVGPGEYALLQDVGEALARLEAYARSLRERLPDPRRPRVRGDAGDGHAVRTDAEGGVRTADVADPVDAGDA